MGYEVDVLAVGDESKSGDAIAVRFGDRFLDRALKAMAQGHVRGAYRYFIYI